MTEKHRVNIQNGGLVRFGEYLNYVIYIKWKNLTSSYNKSKSDKEK